MSLETSSIPTDVRDVLLDLRYIGGVPSHHKLNIRTATYVSADSIIGGIKRQLDNLFTMEESSSRTVDYINRVIDRAIEVARDNPRWLDLIRSEVIAIKDGLINLISTYERSPYKLGDVNKLKLMLLRIEEDAFTSACKEIPNRLANPLASTSLPIVSPLTNGNPINHSV